MDLYSQNISRIKTLDPKVQLAVSQFHEEAIKKGFPFFIGSARRSQEEQDRLYAQGRTTKGSIVTWTKTSLHTRGLAIDIYPMLIQHIQNDVDFYAELDEIAHEFGIQRDMALIKKGDRGHFSCEFAESIPTVAETIPPAAEVSSQSSLLRGIRRASGIAKSILIRRFNRLFGSKP